MPSYDAFGTVYAGYATEFAAPDNMRYKQTVAPTIWPVSVPEARLQCSLIDEDWDEYLQNLIYAATTVVEKRLTRQILPATWTLSCDAFPAEIQILKLPVRSVESVVYTDYQGTVQTHLNTKYQVDLGSENRPARLKPVWGLIWPVTRVGTYNAVVVTFKSGYDDPASVPQTIKNAILYLVAHWFRNREPVGPNALSAVPNTLDAVLSAEDWGCYS
jgi:uncharacterized phiE125 gp8 family phage protein